MPGAAAVGVLADRMVGEPPPSFPHPVAVFGSLMSRLEVLGYRDDRLAGALYATAGTGIGAGIGGLAQHLGGPFAVVGATWLATAGRMLEQTARTLGDLLVEDDLDAARALLPSLVGRDPAGLDEAEVARAVVESVAENCVDAVVAPALWGALAGAPGVLGHRALNTLDAMVGHHSDRYERFGWASARLDDVAAWAPARLCAVAVAVARPRRARAVLHAVRTQAPAHPSPNAGVAEAAFAAALGVQLGGANRYGDRLEVRAVLGGGPAPGPEDVARACDLLVDVTRVTAAALLAVAAASRLARRRRARGPHGAPGADHCRRPGLG